MTGPSGPSAEDPEGTAGAAGVLGAAEYLAPRARSISDVIKWVGDAFRTPNELLDSEHGRPGEARSAGADEAGDTGTQAEYYFITARECRNKVKTIDKALRGAGWPKKSALAFALAFDDLNDAWGTYKVLLEIYYSVKDEEGAPHDRALRALKVPRRDFINALKAYNMQLEVVLGHIEEIQSKSS